MRRFRIGGRRVGPPRRVAYRMTNGRKFYEKSPRTFPYGVMPYLAFLRVFQEPLAMPASCMYMVVWSQSGKFHSRQLLHNMDYPLQQSMPTSICARHMSFLPGQVF